MSNEHTITGTAANWTAEVEQSDLPVVVDFWAEWCGPCKMIGPVLDEIATELAGQAKVVKVDIDNPDNRELAAQHSITAIPALLFFKGGELVDEIKGAQPKSVITQKLQALA